jgi:hypothetical protein
MPVKHGEALTSHAGQVVPCLGRRSSVWLLLLNRMGGDKEQSRDQPARGARGGTIVSVVATILLVGGFVALMGWLADLA